MKNLLKNRIKQSGTGTFVFYDWKDLGLHEDRVPIGPGLWPSGGGNMWPESGGPIGDRLKPGF